MSHVPHELAEEFPRDAELIHDMKLNDSHFARLVEDYHRINRDVHRAETGVEPVADQTETEWRLTRLRLKDEIAMLLDRAKSPA